MGALTCINDYLKIYGAELGTPCCRSVSGAPSTDGPGLARDQRTEAASISGPNTRDHGNRQAMARGALRGRCGRMRHWQDPHLTGERIHPRGGKPFTALAMVPPQLVEKWARECF